MIHYHGLPITPKAAMHSMAGKFVCVSYATISAPDMVLVHQTMQGWMVDNGAFSHHRKGTKLDPKSFWEWAEEHITPASWAVIPDEIGGDERSNRILESQTPHHLKMAHWKVAPVYHLHESIDQLRHWCDLYPTRICLGSSGDFWRVGTPQWHRRMGEIFDTLSKYHPYTQTHLLRGLRACRDGYPFPLTSADSCDVAINSHSAKNGPHHARLMADDWDKDQPPTKWHFIPQQEALFIA